MAQIEEVLQGLGSARLTHDYDPDVDTAAVFGRVLQIWRDEELIWAGPLLTKTPGKEGIELAARSHEFWLGVDEDGPVIEDREFVAGTNKLSNPGAEVDFLYWRTAENTRWQIVTGGNVIDGTHGFQVMLDPAVDDILQSDESFEADPGMQFQFGGYTQRVYGDVGRLRFRLVYEGRFDPPNILPHPTFDSGWTNASEFPADTSLSSNTLIVGPTTRKQLIPDPSFEAAGTALDATWDDGGGSVIKGTLHARTGSQNAQPVDLDTGGLAIFQTTVKPTEEYEIEGWSGVREDVDTGGTFEGTIFEYGTGDVVTPGTYDVLGSEERTWGQLLEPFFTRVFAKERIPDDQTLLWISLFFAGIDSDHVHSWDDVTITRVTGNHSHMASQEFDVTPQRSYDFRCLVTCDSGMTRGKLHTVVTFGATGRTNIIADLATVDAFPDDDEPIKLMSGTLRPPSGYDRCFVSFLGEDIEGGSFRVTNAEVVDSDTSTMVWDTKTPETLGAYTLYSVTHPAPDGTERVHGELVAEESGEGWLVDATFLKRTGETISTTADVVDACCRNPNNNALLVTPGMIEDTALPYDLRFRNMTNRNVLRQLSRAVMQPPREWRISTDNVLDWGISETLYEDRTDFVLKPSDVFVLETPVTEQSAENSLQTVKVIGAQPTAVGGRKSLIESTATNDPGDKVDYFGNPWDRTRIVADATVDHIDYAASLARYEADLNAENRQSVRLRLADWRALAQFNNGDWIYVYEPEAGLVDYDNEQTIDGEVIWPKKVRVISRTWRLGNGFRAEIRASDDSTTPLENVRWENDTTAEIEVGSFFPEFIADPQAGAQRNQFLRFRASSPR